MEKAKHKLLLLSWLVISTAACIYAYSLLYNFHRGCDLISSNDEWEHQSMAVNYAKGHGLYKLGAYTDIKYYHIDSYDFTFPFLKKIFTEFPTEYYYRSCGFSFVAGTIYKITNTDPFNLRVFNFILIILSWIIICYSIYSISRNIKIFQTLLFLLPAFIISNFYFINLIGDDTLVIFSLSLVFFSLIKWARNPSPITTVLVTICLLFSIFIKSTLIFIPLFLFIFAFIFKEKKRAITVSSIIINSILFVIILFFSSKLNEKNKAYKYPEQEKFHKAVMSAVWTNKDSAFVREYNLSCKKITEFDYTKYKEVASYIFERTFYTKRNFFLTGQSLYLLIDGNNEACSGEVEKHIGSWKPFWKTTPQSYFYNYNGESSPYIEVIKFYLQKPFFIPLIMYKKLFAGYYWNYFFITLCILQLFICLWILIKPENTLNIVAIAASSILFHFVLQKLYLTPFIVVIFCISFLFLIKHLKLKTQEQRIIFFMPYFFIFYFLILTLLLYGIDRYTQIATGLTFVAIVSMLKFIKDKYKSDFPEMNQVTIIDLFVSHRKNIAFTFGVFLIFMLACILCKFGVSNTDEFLALVGIKNQRTTYCFDVVNILKYINYFGLEDVTLYNFRICKVFYNIFNFTLFTFLLHEIIRKQSTYYLKHFKMVLLFIVFAFFSFQFNRGIHYNDIIDTETIAAMLIAAHIYLYRSNKINYILILLNSVFAAILFITKFPLGLIASFIVFYMIWFINAKKIIKISLSFLYILLFTLLVFLYFKHTYGTLNALIENYRFFKTFFTKDRFYVYTIDIYIICSLIIITVLLNIFRKKIRPLLTPRKLAVFFGIFIITEACLFYYSHENRIAYLLYYVLVDAILYSLTIGIVTTVYFQLVRKKEYKKLLLFTFYCSFIFLCFWGSMTLQLVNLALHPLAYTFTILFGLFLLHKEHVLKYFVSLSAAFYILCSIFNPYIYNNQSVFKMNTKCIFPENETFYMNKTSAQYYKNIKQFLQPYKNSPILDFDFLNILYYSEIAPYLEPNFVDDQPSEISCNQLRYFKELNKGAVYPKLAISSLPIDANFYKCLDQYYNIKLGEIAYADFDPTSGYFKKITSNDSVYIHHIIVSTKN